jgi:hypothetical protein
MTNYFPSNQNQNFILINIPELIIVNWSIPDFKSFQTKPWTLTIIMYVLYFQICRTGILYVV